MSAIPKPDWQALECPNCPEPFTREQWLDPDAIHFEGCEPMHADCCDSPTCPQNGGEENWLEAVD